MNPPPYFFQRPSGRWLYRLVLAEIINQREELPNICPFIHTEADIGGIPPVVKHSRRPCGYFDI
jgi:hypothetical protein